MCRAEGEPLAGGWRALEVPEIPPGGEATVAVPISLALAVAPEGELVLDLRVLLARDTSWAAKGHEVVSFQLPLPEAICGGRPVGWPRRSPGAGPLALRQLPGSASVEVSGPGGIVVVVSEATGCLSRFEVAGAPVIAESSEHPMMPCFWQAPTDNDRGGAGGRSHAARWAAAGLDRLAPVAGSVALAAEADPSGLRVVVKASWEMRPGEAARGVSADDGVGVGEVGGSHWLSVKEADAASAGMEPASGPRAGGSEGRVLVSAQYTVAADGAVLVEWAVDAREALPAPLPPDLLPSLARVGAHVPLPPATEEVEWYGRGPHECYPDRKLSAHLGRYRQSVDAMHFPYEVPGECGLRADVRWARLGPAGGPGARVAAAGGAPFHFGVSRFSPAALARAAHNYQLEADAVVHLHVDGAHMGVGGDDSWSPSVHPEFLVPPAEYTLAFELRAGR